MPEKIKPSHNVGLKWKDDEGNDCETKMPTPHANGKRIADLVESNFVDIGSIGAKHYYSKILVHSRSSFIRKRFYGDAWP